MRAFKLISALSIILALTAIAAASASAEVEFLPGKAGTKVTGLSKKATLTAKNAKAEAVGVTCQKSKSTGELKNGKEGKLDITFEECTVAGLAVNSAGDAAKTILAHVAAKACTITTTPLVGGVLLKPEPIELSVPSTKLTVNIEGDVIGRLLPENGGKTSELLTLDLNLKEGAQEFTKCKDGTNPELTEELKAKVDAGTFLAATQSAEGGLLQFGKGEGQEWMT